MTAREAIANFELAAAIELQSTAVKRSEASDADRLFLFELLVLGGEYEAGLDLIERLARRSGYVEGLRRWIDLVVAIEARASLSIRPKFFAPPPKHAKYRWNLLRAERDGRADDARRWLDRADALTPEVRGFVDGREFSAVRETDDRFASVFEVLAGRRPAWIPFEHAKKLVLKEAEGVLDLAFRPAEVVLFDGRTVAVTVPLVGPGSHWKGDDFALGEAADWSDSISGCCLATGAKVYVTGDDDFALNDCRMIEFRPN